MLVILSLLDVDEWDEDRYDAVNLGDIPDELWDLFPSNGKYIVNIMKFAGYVNRASILRLKCDTELTSMFKYVADRSKLVKDKEAMFGVFEIDPSLLAIHPGLKPTFKRFLNKVENLVPKRKKPASCDQELSAKKKKVSKAASSSNTTTNESKVAIVEGLTNRFLKWATKEAEKRGKTVSEEDLKKSFQIKPTESKDFKFFCLQNNCYEDVVLKYVDSNNSINMASAHRHVNCSCWLSEKSEKKPIFRQSSLNFFGSRNKKTVAKGIDIHIETPMKNPKPFSLPLPSLVPPRLTTPVQIKKEKIDQSMMEEKMATKSSDECSEESDGNISDSVIPELDLTLEPRTSQNLTQNSSSSQFDSSLAPSTSQSPSTTSTFSKNC